MWQEPVGPRNCLRPGESPCFTTGLAHAPKRSSECVALPMGSTTLFGAHTGHGRVGTWSLRITLYFLWPQVGKHRDQDVAARLGPRGGGCGTPDGGWFATVRPLQPIAIWGFAPPPPAGREEYRLNDRFDVGGRTQFLVPMIDVDCPRTAHLGQRQYGVRSRWAAVPHYRPTAVRLLQEHPLQDPIIMSVSRRRRETPGNARLPETTRPICS